MRDNGQMLRIGPIPNRPAEWLTINAESHTQRANMNAREGMRRLGILLGACGGILGGCLAYSNAKTTWDNHTEYRKFESRMASATMQKIAKAARDNQNGPWVKHRSEEGSGQVTYEANGQMWEPGREVATQGPASRFGGIPVPASDPWEEAAKDYRKQ